MIEFKNVQAVLEELGKAIKLRYQENLIESDRKASYNLIESIQYHTVINGTEFAIDLEMEDYWKYVEEGRGGGKFPPINKILEWIKIKPVLPTPINGKLPTEQQLAFLIGRKIANEGFEGSYDLEHTLQEVDEEWEQKIIDALNQDIFDGFDQLLLILE